MRILVTGANGFIGEASFRKVNVEGTDNLIQAAHANGVRRFVLCSTAGIYGRRVMIHVSDAVEAFLRAQPADANGSPRPGSGEWDTTPSRT